MTRGEAKRILEFDLDHTHNNESKEALRMAIEALEQEPCDVFDKYGNYKYPSDVELTEPNTATSMPCEDAISRKAVINQIFYSTDNNGDVVLGSALRERIASLPPVTPQPKTGHWIVHPKGIYAHLICDNCLSNAPYDCRTNYCPNCGAKMIEPQERSDTECTKKI